jgi:hypothetical protein
VPGLKEIDGAGVTEPRLSESRFRAPGKAAIRPLLKLVTDPSGQEVAGQPHKLLRSPSWRQLDSDGFRLNRFGIPASSVTWR